MTYQDLINVFTGMSEVLQNAGHFIDVYRNGKTESTWFQCLPSDLDMDVAEKVNLIQPTYKIFFDSRERTISGHGWLKGNPGWTKDESNPNAATKEEIDRIVDEMTDVEVKDFDASSLIIPSFTKERIKSAKIEFTNCPNKQFFFNWCMPK